MRFVLVGLGASLVGCNQYDLFRVAGFQQESFSNRADILFVIDNSDSMFEESSSLAVNFEAFLAGLQSNLDNNDDDVAIDFQLGITTTDVDQHGGRLLGDAPNGFMSRGDPNISRTFLNGLLCDATCIPAGAPINSDPSFRPGDGASNGLSLEYLDSLCGTGNWQGNCGSATEEGIEAVYATMCQSVDPDAAPLACFDDIEVAGMEEPLQPTVSSGSAGAFEGFLRENSTFVAVVVSDEGDASRRLPPGDDFDVPDLYLNLFDQFNQPMRWGLIGKSLEADGSVRCPSTAADWGVRRYNYLVGITDGLYTDIENEACILRDFDSALADLSSLLRNLVTQFGLQVVPIVDTIRVVVDGKGVDPADRAAELDLFGRPVFSDGWSYDPQRNQVQFHGDAIPANDAVVEIYYEPERGNPRELPF